MKKLWPRRDFIEKTLSSLSEALERAGHLEQNSQAEGTCPWLLQVDARLKLWGLGGLIFATTAARDLGISGGLLLLAMGMAGTCGRGVLKMLARLWMGIFLFTGAMALPALVLTPGEAVVLGDWGPLRLFGNWALTQPGLWTALRLLLRTETTATFAALLVLTTPWARLLAALRALRCPALLVLLLGMTHRFICVLLEFSLALFEARRARTVGRLSGARRRLLATSAAGVLFSKSVQRSEAMFEAMQARGFHEKTAAVSLTEFHLQGRDGLAALLFFLPVAGVLWATYAL